MPIHKNYQVARHLFRVTASSDSFLWERMRECYGPFEITLGPDAQCGSRIAFDVEICDDMKEFRSSDLVFTNKDKVEPGFMEISVFKTETEHQFELRYPDSELVNGRLSVSKDYKKARFSLSGSRGHQWYTFNSGMNICFLMATTGLDTLLIHASCVSYQGKAYMFLGKSGTGKSTHSSLWLKHIAGSELLNDDNPVIVVGGEGATVYGSPWSGKTPCYKNDSAPIGAFVRIKQKSENRIMREQPLQAFATLLPSMSTMKWDRRVYNGICDSVARLVATIPLYTLGCRPDQEAAEVCYAEVSKR